MNKTGLPLIAWGLAGLLAIAAGLITLGQQDQRADPEVKSYGPSGMSAFAELLRKNGVDVSINQESKPKLGPNDIAVAFRIIKPTADNLFGQTETPEDRFEDNFWQFIENGGSGIVLPLRQDYLEASRSTQGYPFTTVKDLATGQSFNITSSRVQTSTSFDLPTATSNADYMDLWKDAPDLFLRAYRYGKGTALVVRDGIGVTNRFIDKNDNAKAFTALVAILAKSHKHVVFTEASFGNVSDPGILEAVGPWANAAWQQLIVLGLVVVYTLGKRFGIAEERRTVQRGSRELLDAVADTFGRAKSTQAALATASSSADTDLRLVLKLPKDATRSERDKLIPVTLQNALARLQVASEHPAVTPDQALDLIVRAQSELELFIGPNRAKLRSLAKLRT